MINLLKNTIRLGGRDHMITDFKVWWFVEGHGIFDVLQEALATGLPVVPQSVAIAEPFRGSITYEVLSQQERHLHREERADEVSGDASSAV